MHDGSLARLEDLVDHYSAGGKYDNPNKSRTLKAFHLTDGEKRDLISPFTDRRRTFARSSLGQSLGSVIGD
jgi:hypothetical protein